ncbi:methionyl-tRNA formyltransferase [Anaerotaenia torta]|uniref:methionyl-tRNA formyltransferase n=1 Tax=Anaerotaenia torta TaxID=433293 RepID=UPI003D263E0B
MKILFMGTPDFAAATLDKLIHSRHQLIGVVTQPDKQKGRKQEVSISPVKELALTHAVPVYQPNKVREPEFMEKVRELAPETIIVAAFGQILPKALLDIPPYGCINVHGSLLPKYRGAAPIQYSIIDGEHETGITIMYMDTGIDTGDMILQSKLPIAEDETGGSLFHKMAQLGADLLLEALDQLEAGTAARIPQDNEKASYVKMLTKEMGEMDFTQSADRLERLIRGLNPWPGAYTLLEGKTLKLWRAETEKRDVTGAVPGEVMELREDALVVAAGDGALVIRELQLDGKKRMTAADFLRGRKLLPGVVLGKKKEE